MRLCPACGAAHAAANWACPTCAFVPPRDDDVFVLARHIAAGDGTDASYEVAALAQAEARHFWFRSRARLIAWALARYFPSAATLLDVGCGTGGVLAELQTARPHIALTGSDALLGGLRYARRRLTTAELLQADIRRIPFIRHFDVVCALDVLEHLNDDELVLREMAKAAVDRGGLVLTVPQHPWLWSRADDFSRHRRRYRRSDLVARVQSTGFSILRVTSFVTLLLPLLAYSRLRDRTKETPFDPLDELRLGSAANVVATWSSSLERTAIKAGVSWPIGGSLLIVAVKS